MYSLFSYHVVFSSKEPYEELFYIKRTSTCNKKAKRNVQLLPVSCLTRLYCRSSCCFSVFPQDGSGKKQKGFLQSTRQDVTCHSMENAKGLICWLFQYQFWCSPKGKSNSVPTVRHLKLAFAKQNAWQRETYLSGSPEISMVDSVRSPYVVRTESVRSIETRFAVFTTVKPSNEGLCFTKYGPPKKTSHSVLTVRHLKLAFAKQSAWQHETFCSKHRLENKTSNYVVLRTEYVRAPYGVRTYSVWSTYVLRTEPRKEISVPISATYASNCFVFWLW